MQNLNKDGDFSFMSVIRQLKPSEILIFIPFVTYFLGFVITNLYLGTLGIVNLELFRVKYILVGTLFVVYYGVLIVMLQGAFNIIYKVIDLKEKFIKLLWYSVQIYGLPYLLMILLKSISGVTVPPTVFLPKQGLVNNNLGIVSQAKESEILSFFVIVILLVAFIAYIRMPLKKEVGNKNFFLNLYLFLKDLLFFLLAGFLFVFSALYIKNYLTKLVNEFSLNILERPALSWENVISLHSSLYLFIVMSMFVIVSLIHKQLMQTGEIKKVEDSLLDPFIPKNWLNVFIVGTVFVLALNLYTLAVYPGLPQQVGGGAVIPVAVVSSSPALTTEFDGCINGVFLIERSNSGTIFLIINNTLSKISFIEVSNSEIDAIYYYPDCTN